jgi:hypothetical protein
MFRRQEARGAVPYACPTASCAMFLEQRGWHFIASEDFKLKLPALVQHFDSDGISIWLFAVS